MATKIKYDLLMPRLAGTGAGAVFAAGNFVRKTGPVAALGVAARLPGGSIGVHYANKGAVASLCGCSLSSGTKDTEPRITDSGKVARVAEAVTCRFCQARLVSAGVLPADKASEYAADYGTRDPESEMKAMEDRAAKAAK